MEATSPLRRKKNPYGCGARNGRGEGGGRRRRGVKKGKNKVRN